MANMMLNEADDSPTTYEASNEHSNLLGPSNLTRVEVPVMSPAQPTDRDHDLHVRRRLYVSHTLAAWNSRTFEFGAVLFLSAMYPSTLLPASLYAMVRNLAAVLFSSSAGSMVDRLQRITVVRLSIIGQRCAVFLSCLLFLFLHTLHGARSTSFWLALGLLSFLAGIEKLSAVLNTISIERDWVVVISRDSMEALRSINSIIRRIDLACKLIAPLIIALSHSISPLAGIIVALATALISMPVEYVLIARVYAACPDLSLRSERPSTDSAINTSYVTRILNIATSSANDLVYYYKHRAFLPSFSLSLLYLTVLSFAGQMVSYLVSRGFPSWSIGVLRTVSAISEISATWLAPIVMDRLGAVRSGIWLLNWQLGCLLIATAAMWADGSQTILLAFFLPGVIASRAGLWGFDLCAQYLIQEDVEAEARGRFSSIETSFQNFFELLAFASTIVFSHPADFKYPSAISAGATGISAVLYAMHVRQRRGHLFHTSKCLDRKQMRQGIYERVAGEDTEH